MSRTKISLKLRKITERTIASVVTFAIILSTVTVLSLVSFAGNDGKKMITIKSDKTNISNALIPIVNPDKNVHKSEEYMKISFKAIMSEGTKPIIGVLKLAPMTSKLKGYPQPAYVENTVESKDAAANTASAMGLYCDYNPATFKYTAIVKFNFSKSISSADDAHNDISGYITIGNSELSTTVGSTDTADKNASFTFADLSVKSMKYDAGEWKETGDNLAPDMTGDTIDFTYPYNSTANTYLSGQQIASYAPTTTSNLVAYAPKGKYLTMNTALIEYSDYDESVFSNHPLTFHPEVEPTSTSDGVKEYYTCSCEECVGKKYKFRSTTTTITDKELIIPKTTKKMIVVKKSEKASGIVIPFAVNDAVQALATPADVTGGNDSYDAYAKVRFKARMFSGTKPIIGVVGVDNKTAVTYKDSANNENASDPKLYCSYDESTLAYEAVVKIPTSKDNTGNDFALTIGNAEFDGESIDSKDYDVSFAFDDFSVTLLKANGDELEIPAFCPSEINDYNTMFVNDKGEDIIYTSVSDFISSARVKDFFRFGEGETEKADVPTKFFDSTHKFTYIPYKAPTEDEDGNKEHYYCSCNAADCCFKDKKYFDKGYTEAAESEIIIKKFQMITIGKGSNTNVFVPLNLSGVVKPEHIVDYTDELVGSVFVKVSFKTRIIEGGDNAKPIVSRVRGSSDQPQGKGAYSEPDFADNKNSTPAEPGQPPVLYSRIDKETGKFEAVVKLVVGKWWSTIEEKGGVHDAIVIGTAEHNGTGYSENDKSVAFSFSSPEMYLLNATTGEVDTSTGNLLPSINEETVNFGSNYYEHKNNPWTADNNMMFAPLNKWSIDGNPNDVKMEEIPEKYFGAYKFEYQKQVDPTATTEGSKAHYICNCGKDDCIYNGKKYWDRGLTEITDPENELKITYAKMITIKSGSFSNAYIPLDLTKYVKDEYKDSDGYSYVQLRFKARMFNGEKPIVSRIRGDKSTGKEGSHAEKDYVENSDEVYDGIVDGKPDLYCSYNEDTFEYVAIIRLGVGKDWSTVSTGAHDAILIGNGEHNGGAFSESNSSASFSFTQPELYFVNAKDFYINKKTGETKKELGEGDIASDYIAPGAVDLSTGNLMPPICEENLNKGEKDGELKAYQYKKDPYTEADHILTAPLNKWSTDGDASMVIYDNFEPKYFDYRFQLVKQEDPTMTTEGHKEYYECVCTDPDCIYKGRKFSDKGMTEITDESTLILGKAKMITVGGGSNDNAYIPLNISNKLNSKYKDAGGYSYVLLTFKARMYSGAKPIVSRVRGDKSTGKEGSHAEKDYVDNSDSVYDGAIENENDNKTCLSPDLYCKYDEKTNTYVAVLRLGVGVSWSSLSSGIHDAILIGHSEHNGGTFTGESNSSASFSFTQPELYFIDIQKDISTEEKLFEAVDKTTGNLIAPICEQTTQNMDKTYEYTGDPTVSSSHLLMAQKDTWNIDGENKNNGIKVENIPDAKYFTHYFVYHKQVNPTRTVTGTKAYYTCECEDNECQYKGKYYSDKGVHELDSITYGTTKMITVLNGANNNVFVPINVSEFAKAHPEYCVGDYSYFRIRFKARMYNGEKPIVSRIRGSSDQTNSQGQKIQGSYSEPDYVDNTTTEGGFNDQGNPILYSSYNKETCEYTAVIKLGTKTSWSTLANGVHDAILIGNAEHNGGSYSSETDSSVAFVFCDPELYFINPKQVYINKSTGETKEVLGGGDIASDYIAPGGVNESTGNLIAPICDETLNLNSSYVHTGNPCAESNHILSAPQDNWSVDGDKSLVKAAAIDDDIIKYYPFVKHDKVNPTPTTTGHKAYYSCDCGNKDCIYDGKYYSDFGLTEVTNINYGTSKMITVGGGANNNVYVPLNLKPYYTDKYKANDGYAYMRIRFTARMIEGNKPIISRIRGSSDQTDSQGQNIQGSYSEPDDADNTTSMGGFNENGNPILYSNFNEETCQYTAVVRIRIGVSWSTLNSGIHDAILIGNAEHNGKGYSAETDSNVSFAFCDPELYFINPKQVYINKSTGETKEVLGGGDIASDYIAPGGVIESTGNLIAPICDETLNFNKSYEHYDNPCAYSNHILSAPKEMWSIDGSTSNVTADTIPENFFKYYNFQYHKQVNPTSTTTGTKAYYSCECGDPNCMYNGKFYSDKGFTEITNLTLGKSKMILVGGNSPGKETVANVFVPLNIKNYVKSQHKNESGFTFVKLTFKAKMLSGTYPITSVIRGSSDLRDENGNSIQGSYSEPGYADNDDHTYDGIENKNEEGTTKGPDLYSEYDPETNTYTSILQIRVGTAFSTIANGVHNAILIGNAEHNGNGISERNYNNSFIFSEPELYLLNASTGEVDTETGNLITPICNDTVDLKTAYKHGECLSINGNNPCNLPNHVLSAPKEIWSIDGNKDLISMYDIPDGFFDAEPHTTVVKVTNGNTSSLISTKCDLQPKSNYKVDIDVNATGGGKLDVNYYFLSASGEYVSASDIGAKIDTTVDNVEGKHYAAVISTPEANMLGTSDKNFKIVIGAKGGTVEFTNVQIRPISLSGKYGYNLLPNGNFSFAAAGSKDYNKIFTFWNIENTTEVKKVNTSNVADGQFADTTPIGAYVSGSTGKITTSVTLKPNTNYVLRFGSKYNGDSKAKPYVELKTKSGTTSKIGTYSNNVSDMYNTVYKFKTPANLVSGKNATVGVNINSKNIDGTFSNFELYELTAQGTDKGNNLISDPYLNTAGKESSKWTFSEGLNKELREISIYYFRMLKPNLLIFTGKNGYDSKLGEDGKVKYAGETQAFVENTATVQNGKEYIFSVNYKFANEGYQNKDIGPEILLNTAEGFTAVEDAEVIDSKTEYKKTYIFTPSGISESLDNFKFKFKVSGAVTSGYLANALLYECKDGKPVGEQLLENGDFSTGDASEWTKSANSGHFYNFIFTEFPENYFSKTNPPKPGMAIYRNPDDYAQFKQHIMLKPNSYYQVEYKDKVSSVKFEDQTPYISIYNCLYDKKEGQYVINDSGNVSSSTVSIDSYTYKSSDGKIRRFTTNDEIRTTGDGNIFLFLTARAGNAGYWGDVSIYELDANGKKIGNNLVLNSDFVLGDAAWEIEKSINLRYVEQPDGFFSPDYKDEPDTMIYSNGTEKDKTYGNTFGLKKGETYYFTGKYINMNSVGITPEIKYLDVNGEYKTLSVNQFYDPDRYYFEIAFSVPDDALVVDGIATVKVQMNNGKYGKGYFHSLMLTEGRKYTNMFDSKGFVSGGNNYKKMKYDDSVFVFYYDDSQFDDGDWSGEAALTDSDINGMVCDEDLEPMKGIKMVLKPGNKTSVTNEEGAYSFKGLKPGKYTLYLISQKDGREIFCIELNVEECQSITVPMIIYHLNNDNGEGNEDDVFDDGSDVSDIDDDIIDVDSDDVVVKSKCMVMCMLFDADGKKMTDMPVFIESNGYAITNEKGIAVFNNIQNLGKKRVYLNLDNGKKYVFKKINLVEGKGLKVKLIYDPDEGDNTLLYILIFGGAGLIIIAAAATILLIIFKKKKKQQEE
ncbi:MAG: carboxypeptidase-like regulatory domain-containing protein [Clostridia bacterium]|nr:carboxypeptidase-like regulatory domain-containing protein [Clostridia bacterium]